MTIKITWLGTACFILQLDEVKILFDPFFYRNKESNPILKTKKEDIEDISAIFITHGHFDHIFDAGWFAENLKVPVYCSEAAKNNIIQLANGKTVEDYTLSISGKAKSKIKCINDFDEIKISENIMVEVIKSEHIKFDANTILSRLFSWKLLKEIRSLARYGKGFPMGKVFGFCTCYNDIKVVSFGSLWHKYINVLKKYQNCDVFLAPIAGNSKRHLAKKASDIIKILNPKIVIPYHWDDFFPPISRTENLKPFLKTLTKIYPDIQVIMPIIDQELTIDVK